MEAAKKQTSPLLDIPEREYHRIKRLSKSLISGENGWRSPMHLALAMAAPERRKESWDQGSAFHAFILEPDLFDEKIAIRPDCPRRSNADKEIHAKFEAANAEKAWIKGEYMTALEAMREAVRSHAECQRLLAHGQAEKALFWSDEYGLEWKMRMDWLTSINGEFIIADLKKCGKGAGPKEFQKAIADYRYHWQKYLYCEGFLANLHVPARFIFIAVEDSEPYGVGVYELDESWHEAAAAKVEPIREQLANLKDVPQSEWPGYSQGINTLSAPSWA